MSAALLSEEQWTEFFRRLEGPEGCDFQEKEPGDVGSITWNCKGGMDQSYAKAILKEMQLPASTVDAVLTYVRELGGHCDCEILFNAVERVYADVDAAKMRVPGG